MVAPSRHNNKPVVRKGPLCIGAVLLLVVPIAIVNILSTTLDSKAHLQRGDQLVEHHAWKAEQNPSSMRGSNDKYTGPSYTATRGTIVAETATAACEIHPSGQLMLQVQDIVQIVVVDTQEHLWLVRVPSDDPKLLAVPTNAGVDYKYEPASGYLEPQTRKGPWYVAQRIVLQTFGLDPIPWSSIQKVPLALDEFGLLQGAIHSAEEQSDWTFLGRHVHSSERGGGFVYMYLVHNIQVPVVSSQSPNMKSWTISEVQEALLQGKFPDARSVATMTMGLLKYQQLQMNVA
jgi:hypothetical protein